MVVVLFNNWKLKPFVFPVFTKGFANYSGMFIKRLLAIEETNALGYICFYDLHVAEWVLFFTAIDIQAIR